MDVGVGVDAVEVRGRRRYQCEESSSGHNWPILACRDKGHVGASISRGAPSQSPDRFR